MATVAAQVSDMLVTVKAREIQRATLAEMAANRAAAVRHFLAAAHLELVLAADYDALGNDDLAVRSRLSAASCLWRAGLHDRGRELLDELRRDHPLASALVQTTADELVRDYPSPSSGPNGGSGVP